MEIIYKPSPPSFRSFLAVVNEILDRASQETRIAFYCSSRIQAMKGYEKAIEKGFDAIMSHHALADSERIGNLTRFQRGEVHVIFTTMVSLVENIDTKTDINVLFITYFNSARRFSPRIVDYMRNNGVVFTEQYEISRIVNNREVFNMNTSELVLVYHPDFGTRVHQLVELPRQNVV